MDENPKPKMKLLRLPEVLSRVGIGRSSWNRGRKAGLFPNGVLISARARGWPESDIDQLIEKLIMKSKKKEV